MATVNWHCGICNMQGYRGALDMWFHLAAFHGLAAGRIMAIAAALVVYVGRAP